MYVADYRREKLCALDVNWKFCGVDNLNDIFCEMLYGNILDSKINLPVLTRLCNFRILNLPLYCQLGISSLNSFLPSLNSTIVYPEIWILWCTVQLRLWFIRALNYSDVIMSTMATQITGVSIVYSTICSAADQIKHQSSASLACVWGECIGDRWLPRTKGQ